MKKKINIILLLFVISIWIKVLYNLFMPSKIHTEKPIIQPSTKNHVVANKKSVDIKPIKDPFNPISHKKRTNTPSNKKSNHTSKRRSSKKNIKEIRYPVLSYLGYIKSSHTNTPTILLKIDHKLYKTKLNQEVQKGIRIQKFYTDSIVVLCFKKRIILKKRYNK